MAVVRMGQNFETGSLSLIDKMPALHDARGTYLHLLGQPWNFKTQKIDNNNAS
jgi:hypothetical protein